MSLTEKLFKVKERGSSTKTEFLGAVSAYLAVCYLFIVVPGMLADAGMPIGDATVATIWAAVLGTLMIAFIANYPVVVAPGLGISAYFAYYVCGAMGLSWQAACAAVVISGFVFFILTVTRVRQAIIKAIPLDLKLAIVAGIGAFITIIGLKNAGIVGCGGATFPTHVKISSGLGKVDYVIINAAECEPYITGDHRTMLERPEQVIKGATLLAKCFGVDKVYIGVEANKQNAADVLNKTIAELKAPVVVEVLHTRYPQGAEKQLCQAISGRQVPSGKLPADAGCCIFNLNTTCSIYKAVCTGMPVVSKIVTVSGSGVIEPKNIECPIGTPITDLFDACGGLREDTYKLIMGGPMMGLAQYDVDVTVGKGTGAMLAFAGDEEKYVAEPQCIRCGKCVGVCPMRLEPVFMYKYLQKGDVDTWQNVLHGMDCIECGACAYTCPARLPLTHMFRMGKQKVNNARMAAKAKAEAEKKAAEEKKEA